MATDRARKSYDATRRYRSVVAQQGRVTLEADLNEAEEIRTAEARAELLEIVGPTGTPDDGFKIGVPGTPNSFDFAIAAGCLYLGGARIEQSAATTYEGHKQTEWRDFPAGVPASAPDPTPAHSLPFNELVYLAVREQEVRAVEDPTLREAALGGPDTAGRTRLVARVMRAPAATTDCADALDQALLDAFPGLKLDPKTMRLVAQGGLKVDFTPVPSSANPCQPTAEPGFLGPDNQLIRLQITTDRSALLWGYDNASFLYRGWVQSDQKSIRLEQRPVDTEHFPKPRQYVEVLNVAVTLDADARIAAPSGDPYALDDYRSNDNLLLLPSVVPQAAGAEVFVRMWENRAALPANAATAVELVKFDGSSTGMRVYFQGLAAAGDFWMIGVRPSEPSTILPARFKLDFQPPDGPHRWATSLATLEWSAPGTARVHDCRRFFHNLVVLTRAECCELKLKPEDDLQPLVDKRIRLNASLGIDGLHVRFVAGKFSLREPLRFTALARGHLTISGCGLASEVSAAGSETVIETSGWDTTTVTDLSLSAGVAAANVDGLGGALTILRTRAATIERVVARGASNSQRAASCLTVRNADSATDTSARVRSCELGVGQNQTGVLLLNTATATVEDNTIRLLASSTTIPFKTTTRTLIYQLRIARDRGYEPAPGDNRSIVKWPLWEANFLWLTTDETLATAWHTALTALRERLPTHAGDLTANDRRRVHAILTKAVAQILHPEKTGPLPATAVREFAQVLEARKQAPRTAVAAGQGIVIGGSVAKDVRVLHNSIAGVMDGIRVGLSAKGARNSHLRAGRVQIVGNTIGHLVPIDASSSHAGIFVGNVDYATIRDNQVRGLMNVVKEGAQTRPTTRKCEAIRVWGVPGDGDGHFLLVAGNSSEDASVGIRIEQVRDWSQTDRPAPLCLITQNLAVRATTATSPPSSTGPIVIAGDNVPPPP